MSWCWNDGKSARVLGMAGAWLLSLLTAPSAQANVIDVLVLYTPGVEARYAGNPQTRFQHLLNVSNQVYVDSGVDLQVRMAGAVKVNYSDTGSANTALEDVTHGRKAFTNIESLRRQYQADMVLLYRVYQASHGSCGLAWINKGNQGQLSGESDKKYMFTHVGIDACPDHTTVHELGHNMGLTHSRLQDGEGGTFPYALGYGVSGVFTDIMAYSAGFGVDYWTGTVYKLSNPAILCRGLPCGVPRERPDGADAAFAINQVAPQIAAFFGARAVSASSNQQSVLQQVHDEAVLARDAQLRKLNEAIALQARARADVDAIKRRGGRALVMYETKLASLAMQQRTLTTLRNGVTSAEASLARVTNVFAVRAAERQRDLAIANYNRQAARIQALQAEVEALYAPLRVLLDELRQGTESLTLATTQVQEALAKYESLKREVAVAAARSKTLKSG